MIPEAIIQQNEEIQQCYHLHDLPNYIFQAKFYFLSLSKNKKLSGHTYKLVPDNWNMSCRIG